MFRSTTLALALAALVAGCAQSDLVTGAPPGNNPATTLATSGDGGSDDGAGGGHGAGDGGSDATSAGGDGPSSSGPGSGGEAADEGASSTGGASSTASGGASECGDGVVAIDEECDDGNAITDDGCTACVIDCVAPGVKDPASGHCYQVFPDATTWPFAEANCAAWGGSSGLGHLASIADDLEQDFVYSLITAQAWIGIQDPITEGDYQWSDDSFWDYEHWAPGEPDNTNEEDCAFMRTTDDGGWNDHACGDMRPSYVCERRGAGTF